MADITTISPNGIDAGSRTIKITEPALAKINAAFAQQRPSSNDLGLRLEVSGGGCAGLTYALGFENGAQPRDRVFQFGNLRLFVAPKSFIYLAGSILDWEESRGFNVIDSNWPNPCGCGSSFATKSALHSGKSS